MIIKSIEQFIRNHEKYMHFCAIIYNFFGMNK